MFVSTILDNIVLDCCVFGFFPTTTLYYFLSMAKPALIFLEQEVILILPKLK